VKLDLPDELVPVTIRALENYAAYLKATNRDDRLSLQAMECLRTAERKSPAREEPDRIVKKKRA
jgi:hypothetical protein